MKLQVKEQCYKELCENIRVYFKVSKVSMHKARNEIKIISFSGQSLVVKSFKIPNVLNKFVYTFFRDSKAKKSYANSIKIIGFVPKPIGYIEFKKFGLIDESYFVSENFKYDFTIREALKKRIEGKIDIDYENIYKAFANFTYTLHEKEIFHDDYSPGNILIKEKNGGYIFKVVDINRMLFGKLDLDKRAKNFEKLWATDEILTIIGEEYIKCYGEINNQFIDKMVYYSNKNKKIKNFKKRLKGIPVVD